MEERPVIRISVRNLVEFILRSGDIDSRTGGMPDAEAMQMGSRIHRKIQKSMGPDYHAEVPLKTVVPFEIFDLQVEGRADGILLQDNTVMIDEIKGVLRDLELLEEPVGVHLAQAKCYAYMYGKNHMPVQNTLTGTIQSVDSGTDSGMDSGTVQDTNECADPDGEKIKVRMTYCQMETETLKYFDFAYTFTELEQWFLEVVGQYEKWAGFQIEWRRTRNESVKQIEFPFPYREGQRDLVASVYRTILRKKQLFIQAPTGVGKTIATVFPAVKAVGEGLGEKIFYLTAKTITRTVAEQAFLLLKKQGLKLKAITLTAKEKICFCEETKCNPQDCPYAKGHYDRVNEAVFEFLVSAKEMNRDALEEQARKHMVCPFEMSLDVSTWVDAVICDYNYVFDPNAHLKRFFSEGSSSGNYLFLIDEAHNLVERGREMYSAPIYKEDLLAAKKAVRPEYPGLARKLDVCNKQLLELKRECENYQVHNSVSHIYLSLMNVQTEMEKFMEVCEKESLKEELKDLYFAIRDFLTIYDRLDENYVIYTEMQADGRFLLKLFCVNPAVNLKEYLDQGNSAVFFSATLLPIQYYKELLSTNKDDYAVYALSPFDPDNRLLLIGGEVSTKYTLRGQVMYQKIARYLLHMVRQKKGNYIAFFPSYKMMEEIYECFIGETERERGEKVETIIQTQRMLETEREEFLQAFEEEREYSMLGFCVLGGIFSEGIDLTADRLIGAAIVGTGLPQVCNEREILKQYFDKRQMRGFDYAYLYPGMNKVLQAAGRVIRTGEDKGVILLLDERFLGRQYQETFPREWAGYGTCRLEQLDGILSRFWSRWSIGEEKK